MVLRSARTAEEAWDLLRDFPIAAIITDIQLPNMTGLELISRIRREPALERLPIVVVSADTEPCYTPLGPAIGRQRLLRQTIFPGSDSKKTGGTDLWMIAEYATGSSGADTR